MLDLSFDPFPEITTDRLILRRMVKKDHKDFFAIRSNLELMGKLDKEPVSSLKELKPFLKIINIGIDNNTAIMWALCLKSDGRQIGSLSFHNIYKEHHRAEIGYALLPKFHRQGIMNEATKAIISFGFEKLNFHSIEAKINPTNQASMNLLLRSGFTKEAHFKENYLVRGTFSDTAIYSLLRSDFLRSSNN